MDTSYRGAEEIERSSNRGLIPPGSGVLVTAVRRVRVLDGRQSVKLAPSRCGQNKRTRELPEIILEVKGTNEIFAAVSCITASAKYSRPSVTNCQREMFHGRQFEARP